MFIGIVINKVSKLRSINELKGKCHEIFDFMYFSWVYHKSHFNFFSQKFSEIFAAQDALPVSLTQVANEINLQSEKFYYFLGHLWAVLAVYIILFPLFAICVIGTGGAPPQLLGKIIFSGLGEDNSWKTWSKKYCDTVPLRRMTTFYFTTKCVFA
jgi:hypothetical protein